MKCPVVSASGQRKSADAVQTMLARVCLWSRKLGLRCSIYGVWSRAIARIVAKVASRVERRKIGRERIFKLRKVSTDEAFMPRRLGSRLHGGAANTSPAVGGRLTGCKQVRSTRGGSEVRFRSDRISPRYRSLLRCCPSVEFFASEALCMKIIRDRRRQKISLLVG